MGFVRVTTGFWVSAYLRRVDTEGCYCSIIKRGAEEAGAIFIILNHVNGEFSLFGPAPQSVFSQTDDSERLFCEVITRQAENTVEEHLLREKSFDPDLWIVENEDRLGRSFLNIISD